VGRRRRAHQYLGDANDGGLKSDLPERGSVGSSSPDTGGFGWRPHGCFDHGFLGYNQCGWRGPRQMAAGGVDSSAMNVRNNEGRSRYELVGDGRVVGIADYVVRGDTLVFPHTEVDPELRGRGLGVMLVREALDDVRRSGRTIVPACWFVAEFIDAHPEYGDLVAA
jgi:uncharacterized protein